MVVMVIVVVVVRMTIGVVLDVGGDGDNDARLSGGGDEGDGARLFMAVIRWLFLNVSIALGSK